MLKTKCKDCTFLEVTCQLGKSLLDEDHTEGYCRHKRTEKWRMKQDPEKECTTEFLLKQVNKEETSLCVVIVVDNDNIDTLKTTLNSINDHRDLVKQIVVAVHKAKDEFLQNILETISSFSMPWNLENIKGDQFITADVYDYVSPLCKTSWIVSVNSGYKFNSSDLETVYNLLAYDKSNYVAFYNDDYCISNIFAFHELGGNYQVMWLDKVKSFSNWEQVCRNLN